MSNLLSNTGLERPNCQYKGALPHPAKPAYLLVWFLDSGIQVRWSCAEHIHSFNSHKGYWVARVEWFEDNEKPQPSPEDDVIGTSIEENHKRWEEKQRALAAQAAAEGRPRAINRRRGF